MGGNAHACGGVRTPRVTAEREGGRVRDEPESRDEPMSSWAGRVGLYLGILCIQIKCVRHLYAEPRRDKGLLRWEAICATQ